MATYSEAQIRYWLRVVKVGLGITLVTLVVVAVGLFVPGRGRISTGPYVGVLVAAAAGGAGVWLLPWRRLFELGRGVACLYAWSVADIVLVSLIVAASGGGRSDLFPIYVLTTVFFGASYPPRGQVALLAFTLASYLSVLAWTGFHIPAFTLFMRLSTLAVTAALTSFLSRELLRQMRSENDSRAQSERWAALLGTVAEAARAMTLDPERVVEVAIQSVGRLGFEGAALCVLDEGGQTYSVIHQSGLPESISHATFPISAGVASLVLQGGDTVVVDDYGERPEAIAAVRDAGFQVVVASPVWVRGWLAGVLIGATRAKLSPSRQDAEALELMAAQAGMALENAQRFEEEHRSVERLEELDRMKSDFLATVSHELRTPVTVIEGAGLTLEHAWGSLDDSTRLELLGGLNANARALAGLITNLLDFSRLEGGLAQGPFAPFDLSELLTRTGSRLAMLFADHGLDLAVPAGLVIEGDAMLMERVVENLLANAAKHTPPGTTVRLSVERVGEFAEVSVSDNGPGIPAEELAHVGDRFFRGGELNARTRGLGLGLALAKEILALHGTELGVQSEPGRGSTFSFRLPLADTGPKGALGTRVGGSGERATETGRLSGKESLPATARASGAG